MRPAELEAVGALAADALAGTAGVVAAMHDGIAGRVFGAIGPVAAPVRVVHDGIARAVHGGVRRALPPAARAGAAAVARHAGAEDASPLRSAPRAAPALAALHGLFGDRLGNGPLSVAMTLRHDGDDVPVTREALAAVHPGATPRVVVFVHGLFGDDASWRRSGRTYGERLQDELGFTALHVRYATGQRISDSGRALAALLDELAAAWPLALEQLVLVGHSMGGLVARSACHTGARDGRRWVDAVTHVVCLGSPHLGADLEKGANALGWALRRLPETRALAGVLEARSAGIKDLRYGACAEEDWRDADPDELLRDRCTEMAFLPHARFCFVASTLRPGPVGALLGDLLVRTPSASGRGAGSGRVVPFAAQDGLELEGAGHMALLGHPEVSEQLVRWLTPAGARSAAARRSRSAPGAPPSG